MLLGDTIHIHNKTKIIWGAEKYNEINKSEIEKARHKRRTGKCNWGNMRGPTIHKAEKTGVVTPNWARKLRNKNGESRGKTYSKVGNIAKRLPGNTQINKCIETDINDISACVKKMRRNLHTLLIHLTLKTCETKGHAEACPLHIIQPQYQTSIETWNAKKHIMY